MTYRVLATIFSLWVLAGFVLWPLRLWGSRWAPWVERAPTFLFVWPPLFLVVGLYYFPGSLLPSFWD